jgi:hypothetical protein
VGAPLPNPLVVEVTDASGTPVPGVDVQWAAQGGGTISASTVKTGSNGRASVQRTLGPSAGEQTTTATSAGLKGSPVTFVSTAGQAGSPASIAITTNPPVRALDQEVFDPSVQPTVLVKDADGNPLAGVEVTATVLSGGSLQGATKATSDGNGVATFADLGISGTGDHTLEFTAGTASVTSSPVTIGALPTEATKGKWGPVVNWDIVPLHMSLFPNGNIIAWGKTDVPPDTMGMPRIWNPAAGPPTTARMIDVDTMLFCAGYALMPDGRLLVSGGHLKDDRGIPTTRFFTQDGGVSDGPDMAHGRWYPTVTELPDGQRFLTMAGRDQNNVVVTTPEIWENNHWVELPGAGSLEIPY